MPTNGLAHQFIDVGEIELLLDAGRVSLNRFKTNVQMFRNLPGAVPASQQLEDFQLTVAQLLDGITGLATD